MTIGKSLKLDSYYIATSGQNEASSTQYCRRNMTVLLIHNIERIYGFVKIKELKIWLYGSTMQRSHHGQLFLKKFIWNSSKV